MNALQNAQLPTLPQLAKATAVALGIAATILVTAVLPAEYGIDPTGIGKELGLTTLNNASDGTSRHAAVTTTQSVSVPPPKSATPAVSQTVSRSETPLMNEEMSLTLQPGEGAEIKALMREGEQFVFYWTTNGGMVDFDMHGERPNSGDEFTSYWEAQQQRSAQGAFVAPFTGTHGWYWFNSSDQLVTVKVRASGFYEKLYRPA